MSIYSKIDRYCLLPVADKIMHRSLYRSWKEYERNELLSKEQMEELQNKKLQQLMKHCYNNVPYYRQLFDTSGLTPADIQTRKDLHNLPVLTKQTIRDNYKDIISKDIDQRRYTNESTGGSTGTPLQFIIDTAEWSADWASSFRAWSWHGFRLGEKMFTLGGNSLGGGKFNITASVLGAYVIQFLTTTLYKLQVQSDALPAYKAVVVIVLVILSAPIVREKIAAMFKKLRTPEKAGSNT